MAGARDISDRYTEAVNARDLEAIGNLFAPDGHVEDPTGTFTGRDGVLEFWTTFFEAFPDLEANDVLKADGTNVAMNEWSAAGTHSGPLATPDGTIEPTGKRVALRGSDLIEVRDGLITSHRVYYDQLLLLTQLGLVPEAAAAR